MTQSYSNDLLRLSYKETNPIETVKVVEAIENDKALKESFESLSGMKAELDQLSYEPSNASIDFILNYSKKRGVTV